METSQKSTLPVWKVTKLKPGQFGLECPRTGCHGKLVVNAQQWIKQEHKFRGRSCPYCFKTAKIPERLRKRTGK